MNSVYYIPCSPDKGVTRVQEQHEKLAVPVVHVCVHMNLVNVAPVNWIVYMSQVCDIIVKH